MIYLKDSLGNVHNFDGHISHRQNVSGYGYHIPSSAINFAASLGLEFKEIVVTYWGAEGDFNFDDIVSFSKDNLTWQTVFYMTTINWESVATGFKTGFLITYILSPLRLGTIHASGDKWGLASTTLAQSGNHKAYAKLVYYAPRYYFPLTQNLIDFAGSSIAFTNANLKNYKGVSYPANTPIFNEGLYLSNEFTDVAKLTFAALTAHTIIAQIKSTRYPTDWVVGGSGGNLLTPNQSNAETDVTGMIGAGGTFSRTITAGEFYAGIAGFKTVSTGSNDVYISTDTPTAVTVNKYYCFSVYAKSSTNAINWQLKIGWYDVNDVFLGNAYSTPVAASTSFTRLFMINKAPAGAAKCRVMAVLITTVSGDTLYADNLMFEQINETNINIWDDGSKNKLYIDIPNNLLKWTDYTSTISCTFPTIQFLTENTAQTRKIVTIVAIHNGATKEIHCKYDGGAFNDGSGALGALIWTNEITLGRFDGSLFNLVQYPYALTVAEYGALNFSLNALRWNNFYIANKTAGVITFDEGKLVDEDGNDISGLTSGDLLTEGTIQMTEGLSAKWGVSISDTMFP